MARAIIGVHIQEVTHGGRLVDVPDLPRVMVVCYCAWPRTALR